MAKRKAGKKATVTFERTDGAKKRLPTRTEMTQWIEAASFVPFEGTVRFVGNEEGQELNRTYRHKDYATNVLTFDYCHKPTAQADIVIATAVIAKEATEYKLPGTSGAHAHPFGSACPRVGSLDGRRSRSHGKSGN